jgi:thiosulfate/3-mercaptopyruvate sulfurtransferase
VLILFFIFAILAGCVEKSGSVPSTELLPGFLVTTEDLSTALSQKNIVIVDARAAEDYQKMHITNAVNIPKTQFRESTALKDVLNYKKDNGFFIPPEMAEKIFSNAGIDAGARVIVYDSVAFPDASIIWALLKYYGHDNVQVLKGGFEKWASEDREVSIRQAKIQKKTFTPKPRPEMVASREWLIKNKDRVSILDMRSLEEYVGVNPAGNPRGGHIPGAISIDWAHLAGNETVKSPAEIQKILKEAGITKDKEIVTYCTIGFGRSTYGLMALKMLGYSNVRVYGGSFEDWSNATELQVATTKIGSFKDWRQ